MPAEFNLPLSARLSGRSLPLWAAWCLLAILLLWGLALRLGRLDEAHFGDMNVLLSAVYSALSWPPFGYYEAYRPQPWVYNHLPAFPFMVAPLYWVFENLLHLPTSWAVKLLTAAADLAIAIMLFRTAGQRFGRILSVLLPAAWLFAPWVVAGNDHPISPAVAFALAALTQLRRPVLCAVLLALGMGTRNEVAFLVLPVLIHFALRRPRSEFVSFLLGFSVPLALLVLPFALHDLEALDYALRRQLQRDVGSQLSILASALLPLMPQRVSILIRENPSILAVAGNLVVGAYCLRDRSVLRGAVVASLMYLVTLPLLHERYTLFAYGLALLYTARYGNLLVLAGALLMELPFPGAVRSVATVSLLGGMGGSGLWAPGPKSGDEAREADAKGLDDPALDRTAARP
ncbi:MAG TPA: hypothetical protein VFD42_08815 [Chloroflexota bacterium]|nr:hypothetical protein [Chloroflexota bacterium]